MSGRLLLRVLTVPLVTVLLAGLFPGGSTPAQAAVVTPPSVAGAPVVGKMLTLTPGSYDIAPATVHYQWLRDGQPIIGANALTYRLSEFDLGAQISAQENATDAAAVVTTSTSNALGPVLLPALNLRTEPSVRGVTRFEQVLRARPGAVRPRAEKVRLRWLIDGEAVAKAKRYRVAHSDVGGRLSLSVTYRRAGYQPLVIETKPVKVRHRVPVRRIFTYSVETRGAVRADVKEFARLAQQTYDDPRGWRAAGFEFRRVARGGQFTLVLANARTLPGFSSGCSVVWSCRVGRFVVINQERWLHASPAWNAGALELADYRNMVVNHETGHWLGHGHVGCTGGLAPVMMQQSKGRAGCQFNPWPKPSERWARP